MEGITVSWKIFRLLLVIAEVLRALLDLFTWGQPDIYKVQLGLLLARRDVLGTMDSLSG
jgi:hypothetical protein